MFKHILVPTDGTELSQNTCRAAVTLAKELGAEITAFHAQAKAASKVFSAAVFDDGLDEATRAQFEKAVEAGARASLDFVEGLCREAGVKCNAVATKTEAPYEGIINAARESGADLIFMASHGARGLKARLIGSETQRVLTNSTIPVLVYRWGDPT